MKSGTGFNFDGIRKWLKTPEGKAVKGINLSKRGSEIIVRVKRGEESESYTIYTKGIVGKYDSVEKKINLVSSEEAEEIKGLVKQKYQKSIKPERGLGFFEAYRQVVNDSGLNEEYNQLLLSEAGGVNLGAREQENYEESKKGDGDDSGERSIGANVANAGGQASIRKRRKPPGTERRVESSKQVPLPAPAQVSGGKDLNSLYRMRRDLLLGKITKDVFRRERVFEYKIDNDKHYIFKTYGSERGLGHYQIDAEDKFSEIKFDDKIDIAHLQAAQAAFYAKPQEVTPISRADLLTELRASMTEEEALDRFSCEALGERGYKFSEKSNRLYDKDNREVLDIFTIVHLIRDAQIRDAQKRQASSQIDLASEVASVRGGDQSEEGSLQSVVSQASSVNRFSLPEGIGDPSSISPMRMAVRELPSNLGKAAAYGVGGALTAAGGVAVAGVATGVIGAGMAVAGASVVATAAGTAAVLPLAAVAYGVEKATTPLTEVEKLKRNLAAAIGNREVEYREPSSSFSRKYKFQGGVLKYVPLGGGASTPLPATEENKGLFEGFLLQERDRGVNDQQNKALKSELIQEVEFALRAESIARGDRDHVAESLGYNLNAEGNAIRIVNEVLGFGDGKEYNQEILVRRLRGQSPEVQKEFRKFIKEYAAGKGKSFDAEANSGESSAESKTHLEKLNKILTQLRKENFDEREELLGKITKDRFGRERVFEYEVEGVRHCIFKTYGSEQGLGHYQIDEEGEFSEIKFDGKIDIAYLQDAKRAFDAKPQEVTPIPRAKLLRQLRDSVGEKDALKGFGEIEGTITRKGYRFLNSRLDVLVDKDNERRVSSVSLIVDLIRESQEKRKDQSVSGENAVADIPAKGARRINLFGARNKEERREAGRQGGQSLLPNLFGKDRHQHTSIEGQGSSPEATQGEPREQKPHEELLGKKDFIRRDMVMKFQVVVEGNLQDRFMYKSPDSSKLFCYRHDEGGMITDLKEGVKIPPQDIRGARTAFTEKQFVYVRAPLLSNLRRSMGSVAEGDGYKSHRFQASKLIKVLVETFNNSKEISNIEKVVELTHQLQREGVEKRGDRFLGLKKELIETVKSELNRVDDRAVYYRAMSKSAYESNANSRALAIVNEFFGDVPKKDVTRESVTEFLRTQPGILPEVMKRYIKNNAEKFSRSENVHMNYLGAVFYEVAATDKYEVSKSNQHLAQAKKAYAKVAGSVDISVDTEESEIGKKALERVIALGRRGIGDEAAKSSSSADAGGGAGMEMVTKADRLDFFQDKLGKNFKIGSAEYEVSWQKTSDGPYAFVADLRSGNSASSSESQKITLDLDGGIKPESALTDLDKLVKSHRVEKYSRERDFSSNRAIAKTKAKDKYNPLAGNLMSKHVIPVIASPDFVASFEQLRNFAIRDKEISVPDENDDQPQKWKITKTGNAVFLTREKPPEINYKIEKDKKNPGKIKVRRFSSARSEGGVKMSALWGGEGDQAIFDKVSRAILLELSSGRVSVEEPLPVATVIQNAASLDHSSSNHSAPESKTDRMPVVVQVAQEIPPTLIVVSSPSSSAATTGANDTPSPQPRRPSATSIRQVITPQEIVVRWKEVQLEEDEERAAPGVKRYVVEKVDKPTAVEYNIKEAGKDKVLFKMTSGGTFYGYQGGGLMTTEKWGKIENPRENKALSGILDLAKKMCDSRAGVISGRT